MKKTIVLVTIATLGLLTSSVSADAFSRLAVLPLTARHDDAMTASGLTTTLEELIELSGWATVLDEASLREGVRELRLPLDEITERVIAEAARGESLEFISRVVEALGVDHLVWGELLGQRRHVLRVGCYERLSGRVIIQFQQTDLATAELEEAIHQVARRLAAGPGHLPVTTPDSPPVPRSPADDPGRLAYSLYQGEVYLSDADGLNERQLTINMRSTDWTPTVSLAPDGYRVAFSTGRHGDGDIYIINIDGTGLRRLTEAEDGWCDYPSWSFDGTRVAFYTDHEGEIVILGHEVATGRREIVSSGMVAQNSPSWSPDGSLVAFYDTSGDGELTIMRSSDHQGRWISKDSTDELAPAWSPDGKNLVFTSYRDGNLELYIVDQYGANPRRLTYNSISDTSPSFSGDGRFLFYQHGRDVRGQIYSLELETNTFRRLTAGGGCHPSWGPTWRPDGLAEPAGEAMEETVEEIFSD